MPKSKPKLKPPKLKYEFNKKDLQKILNKGRDFGRLQKPLAEARNYLLNETKKQFESETDPTGNKWAELKPATIKRKKKPIRIGRETEKMYKTLYAKPISSTSFEIGIGTDYAIFFHKGKKNQEPRPIIGMTPRREQTIRKIIFLFIRNKV